MIEYSRDHSAFDDDDEEEVVRLELLLLLLLLPPIPPSVLLLKSELPLLLLLLLFASIELRPPTPADIILFDVTVADRFRILILLLLLLWPLCELNPFKLKLSPAPTALENKSLEPSPFWEGEVIASAFCGFARSCSIRSLMATDS